MYSFHFKVRMYYGKHNFRNNKKSMNLQTQFDVTSETISSQGEYQHKKITISI